MTRIGIIPSRGFGDGLIFLIAAHNLQEKGFIPTTYSPALSSFRMWLPNTRIHPEIPHVSHFKEHHDALILQHDNSKASYEMADLPIPVFRFFGEYCPKKHGKPRPTDYICDRSIPMAHNVRLAMIRWFGSCSLSNGLIPPSGLVFQKYARRIALHPGSSSSQKNWPLAKFEQISLFLQRSGFEPVWVTNQEGAPQFASLDLLASFLYESYAFIGNDSGPGHLASYLNLPSLIIGPSRSHLNLWQPGWTKSHLAFPPQWSSYIPWDRRNWQKWISTKKIIKILKNNILQTK